MCRMWWENIGFLKPWFFSVYCEPSNQPIPRLNWIFSCSIIIGLSVKICHTVENSVSKFCFFQFSILSHVVLIQPNKLQWSVFFLLDGSMSFIRLLFIFGSIRNFIKFYFNTVSVFHWLWHLNSYKYFWILKLSCLIKKKLIALDVFALYFTALTLA